MSFCKNLPKTLELKKSKIKINKDHLGGTEYIDILVNPTSTADRKKLSEKREGIGWEQKWYHRDMGFMRVQIVEYGKRKDPALLISAIQPGMFWEMPSKFRKKYDDWYKKLYKKMEKIAKEQGIKRVLITTPRTVRKDLIFNTVMGTKFPYDKLDQLYYGFPEKQGFVKKEVLVRGKSGAIQPTMSYFERGRQSVKRKLWFKHIK